jgi:hypothetical protein
LCWDFVIIYGRQSRPSDGSGVPRVNDGVNTDSHWHAAFGIYICDTFQPKIVGSKETAVGAQGNTVLLNDDFRILGVHSHEDGVIHYHPYSTKASGNRAKLGVFLDVYDIELSDTELVMPPDQGGESWSTEDTKCDGKDTDIITRVWDDFSKPDVYRDVVTDMNNIRITNDGMVFVVASRPQGHRYPAADWAAAAAGCCRRWRRGPRQRLSVHHLDHGSSATTTTGNDHHRRLMRAVVLVSGFRYATAALRR